MKMIYTIKKLPVMIVLAATVFAGCFKDKCTKTYRVYTPVYKSKAEARAAVKTGTPRNIVNPGKLYIRGTYIFLNDINRGIHIIDNQNPSSPKNLGFIDIPGNIDIAVKGNTLYADMYSDLLTLNVSNPLQVSIQKVSEKAFAFRQYANGFVADTNNIIVDWKTKDTTIAMDCDGQFNWWSCPTCGFALDVSMASSGTKASAPIGAGGSMARFAIVNSTLYTVSDAELNTFSLSPSGDPVFMNKVSAGWAIETLYPFRDKLFIGSNTGLFIYDISNPEKPSRLGQFAHARSCDPVIADDNYAFVTLREGTRCPAASNQLDVINISTLTSPSLVKTYAMTNPHGLSKDGNTLFVCDGEDGLKVYDASNVRDLKLLSHIRGFQSYDVISQNNIALVVARDGLRQYDYTNPKDIRLLSRIDRMPD